MVDMMFLLLIFVITSTVVRQEERKMEVALPSAETGVNRHAPSFPGEP